MKFSPRHTLASLLSARHDIAGAVIYWSGYGALFEAAAKPSGAIVLMYHSIAPPHLENHIDPRNRLSPEVFERQMAFLARHRRVVSLSMLVEEISSGRSPAAATVCITFDDGYLDNLTYAAPILEKYELPATLFLATGYVERSETQWADTMHWVFRNRRTNRLEIPEIGLDTVDIATPAGMLRARSVLHAQLLESDYERRTAILQTLRTQLRPHGVQPRVTLNWDEARQLVERFPRIEIGGHTRDHIDLRTHGGEAARAQIIGCAKDLRREIGMTPKHFSFPYARWSMRTRDLVRAIGWHSAMGMGERIRVDTGSDLFAVPRVEVTPSMTALRFKTSGAYPGSLPRLRRR